MSCRIVNCLPSADRKKARDWLLLGEKQIAECEQSGTLCACGESVMDNVLVEWRDIHSIGPDAIMVDRDDLLLPVDQSPIKTLPRAKNDLIG